MNVIFVVVVVIETTVLRTAPVECRMDVIILWDSVALVM